LPIQKYPRLTEVGAWRNDSALGPPPPPDEDGRREWRFRGQAHGGSYSPEDVREVVRYAAEHANAIISKMNRAQIKGRRLKVKVA
jgi:hexosaminidase